MSVITQPGIVDKMSMTEYQADPCPAPALSNGIIKTLLGKSPYHAWLRHPRLNPDYKRENDSDFDLGTAAHSMFLEGVDCCVVVDAEDWRTKAAKEQRDAAWAIGRTPLLRKHHMAAQDMVSEARDFIDRTELRGVMRVGKPEQSMFWQDETTGVWCKGRADWLTMDHSLILDYKTSTLAPARWIKGMADMAYDTQSEFYSGGLQTLGTRKPAFFFLVQEAAAPYQCYLVSAAASMVELAQMRLRRVTRLWAECLKTGNFPSYPTQVQPAFATPWQMSEEESQQ